LNSKSTVFLLVAVAFLWGSNPVVGKYLLTEMSPITISFYRWFIASLILIPFVRWNDKKLVGKIFLYWKEILLLGFTGIFGFNTLLYFSVVYTSPINVSLINTFAPILITVLSAWTLKETISRFHIIGMTISFVGVLIIIIGGSWSQFISLKVNMGDLLMIFAIFLWSIYSLAIKRTAGKLPSIVITATSIIAGLFMLTPLMIWETVTSEAAVFYSINIYIGLLYLGVCVSVLAYIWWNQGVQQIGPTKAANFLYLTPLFASIISWIIFGEWIHWNQFVGGFLVILGVYLTTNLSGTRTTGSQSINSGSV
jgi:drug/metabolite transporter (DMT)-like permease